MPPFIPDNGADFPDPTAHRLSYDQWDWQIVNEIISARAEGRPVSFKVPSAVFHESDNG